MNQTLYEVTDAVGLPQGYLGAEMPDVLYKGTIIMGERIAEFLPRLTELECIRVCHDQTVGEKILAVPNDTEKTVKPKPANTVKPANDKPKPDAKPAAAKASNSEPVVKPLEDLPMGDIKKMAKDMGIAFDNKTKKVDLITAIKAVEVETPDGETGSLAGVVEAEPDDDDGDDSDIQGVENGAS